MKSLLYIFFTVFFFLSCKQDKLTIDPVQYSQSTVPCPDIEESEVALGLAGYAKVMCSAIFISEREPEEAFKNSGYLFLPEELQSSPKFDIDYKDKSVMFSLGDTLFRKAKFYGSQGCIICRENLDTLNFTPLDISSSLPPADQQLWPMGDLVDEKSYPANINKVVVEEALDLAFFPEEALTAGIVILYDGQIIGERYMKNIGINTQLESWSMGKSLTATLVGRMIQQRYFQLSDDVLFEEWSSPNDPRSRIRVQDLMQMSGGLKFSAHRDPGADVRNTYLDHFYIYSGAVDAYNFSLNRPLEFNVGTEGRYRNCDPLLLGKLIQQHLEKNNLSYLAYPQKELFDKIGIRKQVLETDPFGNFLLTGFDYGTVRNWARLGQLYLQDGIWEGERILPEGWSKFVSSHAPGWKEPIYGGLFWLNGNEEFPLPKNTYYMAGAGGQRTIIVPEYNLVIVRLGHYRGSAIGMESLNKSISKLLESFL